ncbi:hypothetical protein B0H12DRAFT_1321054 [Mycena haematopus]|nr:hypothetical protein B0H12DRAFT_1321054 [Mycena haematopus]
MPTFKVVVIGASDAGKTSLRGQYFSARFSTSYRATIGADFITKILPPPPSSPSAEPITLYALRRWWDEFKAKAPVREEDLRGGNGRGGFCVVVVGNKIDLLADGDWEADVPPSPISILRHPHLFASHCKSPSQAAFSPHAAVASRSRSRQRASISTATSTLMIYDTPSRSVFSDGASEYYHSTQSLFRDSHWRSSESGDAVRRSDSESEPESEPGNTAALGLSFPRRARYGRHEVVDSLHSIYSAFVVFSLEMWKSNAEKVAFHVRGDSTMAVSDSKIAASQKAFDRHKGFDFMKQQSAVKK